MNELKPTKFITRQHGDNLRKAWMHCAHYGFPLNAAFTIHFAVAGLRGHYIKGRQTVYQRLRKWLQSHGADIFACGWVMESSPQGKDAHLHGAVHLPDNIMTDDLCDFLNGVVGGFENAVDVRPVNDNGWLRYMLKGCHQDDYEYFNIRRKHRKAQGIIWGKRCGVSQAIDSSERNARIDHKRTLTELQIAKRRSNLLEPLTAE
tara:strand:+ start:2555 stop:3166 length:612 start_codon:yes stop_codon:yes gene_type:complete